MTPQQIVGIGIRLVALWLGLLSIRYWGNSLEELFDSSSHDLVAYILGSAHLLAAVVLWIFPMWIAHRIVPHTRFENHVNVQGMDLARAGCSLVGLVTLTIYLGDFAWLIFRLRERLLVVEGSTSFWRAIDFSDKTWLLTLVVMLTFACLLIFRSADFARLVFRRKADSSPEA